MAQFLVTARDGSDADAPARRAAARPAHLARIADDVAAGRIVVGGAVLDERDQPVAPERLSDFLDREALDACLDADPYRRAGVWQRIEVTRFRVAVERRAAEAG